MRFRDGTNDYETMKALTRESNVNPIITNQKGGRFWDPVIIKNVNVDRIKEFGNYINQNSNYHLLFNNMCVR